MSDDFKSAAVGISLIVMVGFVGGVIGSIWSFPTHVEAGRQMMRDEAVKANAAEYYLDASHVRQFRWKGAAQ